MGGQVAACALGERVRTVHPGAPCRSADAGSISRRGSFTISLRGVLAASLGFGLACFPQADAYADVTPSILVTTQVPEHMLAYQERTIAEQGDGDWSALGINAGAFKLSPRVSVGQNFTSNAFATAEGTAAAFERVEVDFRAQSQWSRHSLGLGVNRRWDFYVGHKDRNEDNWSLNASGDVDVTSTVQINVDADLNRIVFNTLTSEFTNGEILTSGAIIALSYDHASIGVTRKAGNSRLIVQAERYHLNFLNADRFPETRAIYLDHDLYQISAQGEYSFTPSFSVFSKLNYATTDYGVGGNLNFNAQDSRGGRFILGARANVSGLGRATVAVAYSRRSYDSANLPRISGLSAQARLDVNLSALTSVNAEIGSRISDVQLISTSASRDTYVQAGVDHALLRNFKLGADARLVRQKPLLSGLPSTYSSLNLRGTYLASRRFGVSGRVSYTNRSSSQSGIAGISELSGGITLTYRI